MENNFFNLSVQKINEYKELFIAQNKYSFDLFVQTNELQNLNNEQFRLFKNYFVLQSAFDTFCNSRKLLSFFIGSDFKLLSLVEKIVLLSIQTVNGENIDTKELYENYTQDLLSYISNR